MAGREEEGRGKEGRREASRAHQAGVSVELSRCSCCTITWGQSLSQSSDVEGVGDAVRQST